MVVLQISQNPPIVDIAGSSQNTAISTQFNGALKGAKPAFVEMYLTSVCRASLGRRD